jgi:hypothetical protein
MTSLCPSRLFHLKPASVSNEVCNPAKNNFLHNFSATVRVCLVLARRRRRANAGLGDTQKSGGHLTDDGGSASGISGDVFL